MRRAGGEEPWEKICVIRPRDRNALVAENGFVFLQSVREGRENDRLPRLRQSKSWDGQSVRDFDYCIEVVEPEVAAVVDALSVGTVIARGL
jgi:hypothetical protein